MDLMSKQNIKNLLKKYGARPSKRLGQNFLIDRSVLRKIIESAELKKEDVVLEIGPGIGTLTQELAKRAKKIIAVEKDRKMCEILKDLLECWNVGNVEIVKGDILKMKLPNYQLQTTNYKLIANLPYYIVSPVIRKFLESVEVESVEVKPLQSPLRSKPPQPKEMILMVQKEVAQRICARPPNMSILAVSVQFYSKPEILFYVSRNSFWPQPKVDSAIIKITPKKPRGERVSPSFRNLFFKIVRVGFSQPRKQVVNNLSKILKLDKEEVKKWLLKNEIKPNQRAETLSVRDWVNLANSYRE